MLRGVEYATQRNLVARKVSKHTRTLTIENQRPGTRQILNVMNCPVEAQR